MTDDQFDELIKNKFQDDRPLIPSNNIDRTIEYGLEIAKRARWRSKIFFAAAIIFLIGGTSSVFLQIELFDQNHTAKKIQMEKDQAPKVAMVDVKQEKEKLAKEGYIVEPGQGIPDGANGNSAGLKDSRYSSTLKDYVYNSNSVLKGEVLGIKYFIRENFAYTKAKFLVEESFVGGYKPGDIVTVVKAGAIITHYEMIIKGGIDQKFNIPEAELEEAKHKMVVADNWGEMIFPNERMIIFTSEEFPTDDINDHAFFITGPIVKFRENKIIKPAPKGMEDSYNTEEFFGSEQLTDLENKINSVVKGMQYYSKEKAQAVAYNYLTEQNKQQIVKPNDAIVRFSSEGTYLDMEKTPANVIVVSFIQKNDAAVTVILSEENYQLYKIEK